MRGHDKNKNASKRSSRIAGENAVDEEICNDASSEESSKAFLIKTLIDDIKGQVATYEAREKQDGLELTEETTIDAGTVKITYKKVRRVAAALAVFFGGFGLHKFYLGYKKTGVTHIVLTVVFLMFASIIKANWPFCIWLMFCTVEGLKYLITPDEEFNRVYVHGQRKYL